MLVVSEHKKNLPRPFNRNYQLAGCHVKVQFDSLRAFALWESLGAKYPLRQIGKKLSASNIGKLQLHTKAIAPALPKSLWQETVDGLTLYHDEQSLWVKLGAASFYVNAVSPLAAKVWLSPRCNKTDWNNGVILTNALQALLRRLGAFGVHAAGLIAPQTNSGTLLLGDSGSGKTTLTMLLAAHGWRYLSDDYLSLRCGSNGVTAWRMLEYFSLTPTTMKVCKVEFSEALQATVNSLDAEKTILAPEKLFVNQAALSCRPSILIFPVLTNDSHSSLTPLSSSAAMVRVLRQCSWLCYDPAIARAEAETLRQLVEQCKSYQLNAGRELLTQPARAHELLTSILT